MIYFKFKKIIINNGQFFISTPTNNTFKRYFNSLKDINKNLNVDNNVLGLFNNINPNIDNYAQSKSNTELQSSIIKLPTNFNNNYLIKIINNTAALDDSSIFYYINKIFNYFKIKFMKNWLLNRKIDRINFALKITSILFKIDQESKEELIETIGIDEDNFNEIINKLEKDEKQLKSLYSNNKETLINIFGITKEVFNTIDIKSENYEYDGMDRIFDGFTNLINENEIPNNNRPLS